MNSGVVTRDSTKCDSRWSTACAQVWSPEVSMPCSCMNETSRSRSRSASGSMPAASVIASRSDRRGHGGVRSTVLPAAAPARDTTFSTSSIPSR